jgi:hypothetical protein
MVRVGGGWDTLQHYLDKHDPCRCRAGKCMYISYVIASFYPVNIVMKEMSLVT